VTTRVRATATVTENGAAPASSKITITIGGKKVSTAVLASGKSAKVTVTAVVNSDSGFVPSVPSGSVASDLFFHDLGAAGCVKTAIFQGLPCNDATVGSETLTASVTVKGYK
jgi:phage tail sheath gpL-like